MPHPSRSRTAAIPVSRHYSGERIIFADREGSIRSGSVPLANHIQTPAFWPNEALWGGQGLYTHPQLPRLVDAEGTAWRNQLKLRTTELNGEGDIQIDGGLSAMPAVPARLPQPHARLFSGARELVVYELRRLWHRIYERERLEYHAKDLRAVLKRMGLGR